MNGQSLASINTQLKKLASDRAHPIILDRISPAELKNMLRNEMSFSLKSFMNFAKSENQNNSQLILHVKQFEALLFQYRNHIGQSDILDCYLEMGQHLINMENCHQVAHFMCFAQALSIMGKMEEGKTRRYHIAVFGSLISNYIQITKFDPNFQMESSISKLDGIMRAFREILAIKDIDEWTQSHAIYYLYQLSKVCMRSSLAATLLLEDHCNWFCEYITEQASPIDQRLFEVISANTHLLHNKKTLESMIKSEIDEQPDTNSATKCRVTLINALFLLQIEKIAGETDEALLTRPNGPTQFSHGIPPVSAELQQFKAYARDIHTETNEDLDLNNLLPFSCMSNFSTLPLKAYDFYPDNIAKYEPSCFKKLEKYLISAKLVLGDKSDNNVQRNQALLLSQIANGADWQFFNENLHARANTKRSDDLLDFKSKRQVLVDLHFLVINYKALSCRLDAILNTLKKRMHHYKSLAIWPKITETECRADFVYFRLLDMAYLMVAQNDPYTLEMLISMFESQNYLRGGLSNPDAPDSSKDIPAGTFLPSQLVTLAMILFHVGQFERCNNIIRLMPHISDSTLQREYALFVSFVTMFYSQQLFKLSGNQNMDNILASIANLSFFIDKSLHLNPRCQLIGDSCLLLSNVSAAPEPALELRYELLSFLVSASMVIEDRADITLCNQCQKLASKYQQKHEFQKARYLWSAGIKLVKHQRYIEGGCAELPWAVTSDTAFHSADNSVKTHRQSLNNLESIELDLLYAFYRCEIFEQEVLSMEHVAKKEIELLRLSQMKRKLPLKSIIPDDHAIEVAVGHSAVRSCLYLLAVCMECQNHNQSEKLQLIQKAYKLIQKACNLESNLVNLQGIDTSQCDIRIVRRTGTSMAIAVNSSKSGWIRIVCKLSGDISGKASSHVLGTNVWYPICGGVEIELNMWQLALEDAMTISAEFSETRGSRTGLIRSNILIADNNPPLPLAAIWGYLSQIAHQNNFHEIADTAFDRGVLYLVAHQAKDLFSTVPIPVGPGSESYFFKLSPFIAHIPLVNLKASVQSIFAKIAREEAVSSQVHIDKHHFSLSLALKLMIAISLAKVCNDSSVILVCCLSLFSKIQDFLRNQHPIQFLTHALFYCFQNLITCADIDVSWDPIVKKYLLPMGQYLITRLLAIEQPFIASKVLQDASAFIGKVITNLSDNRIQSSAIIEQTWIGSARKAKLVKGTNTRNYCMEEFYHNVSVSLKTNPLLGLEDSRCVTDVFLEAMEVRIAQHAHLMPGTQTIDASVDASTLLTSRPILQPKRIVEQQSTLRDIFITFLTCGADWTLQELGKFRKNPRYFELVIKLGQWCLERDQNESAIKIAMEIEEWLEKRSQTFYHFEDIILETDGQREVLVKRRRNLIFADDKAQLKDSMKGVAMAKILKQKKNELITRQSHLRPAVKNGANVENSSNNLASSSVFAVSTSNPTELVEAAPLPENVPKSEKKVSKSKRLGRAGLLLNIAGANQERFDWALRIFEAHIPRYWRRMRLMKRFRNIVKFEGTTRFQHAILKSTAIYSAAVKEWNQTDFHHDIDTFDSEWFELRNSGMPHFGHIHAFKGSSNHYDADTFSGVTGQVSDMLQGFIQAAVLASRAGLRFGILTATKKLWKAIRLCFRFKKFYAAVWKNTLWRGLNIAATTLLDLLQVGKLYSAAKSESFDSTADVDGKVIDHSGSSTLNYVEFSSGERVLLDLKMCSNLCIFAIEMSHLSGKKFRLELLVSKFRKVFGDTYDVILAGVLDSNLPPTTSLGMLFNTRKLTAAYIYDKFRPQRSLIPENSTALALPEIQAVFQNAIEFMSSLKSPLLSGLQLEFGNFLYDTGDIDAAIINWNQSLDTILKKPKFIRNWKNDYRVKGLEAGLLSIHQLERLKMECGGAKQTFMAANIVTMMARVVGSTNHLRRKEYLWLGASFFLAGVSRFGFNVYSGNDVIFNITEVFDDKFSCNPTSTVDNILYLCGNLLEICQHHLVLPLSKVILHIAAKYLLSQDLYVRATIIGSEALIGMGRIAEGVADLTSLARRPGKLDDTVPETSFDENTRILDCSHIKSFRQILSIQFPERYRPRFSSNAINDLEIAKASTVLYLLKYLMNRGFETSAELCDVMAAIQKSLITVAERIQSAIKPKSAPDTRYKEKVAPMPNYVGHYQRLATCFKLITKTYLYLKRAIAMRCYFSNLLHDSDEQVSAFISTCEEDIFLSGRHLIIRCLNAEGKFSVASDLALEGMQIAMNDCSEYYALKFSLQIQNYISHEPKLDDRNLDIPIFADLVSKFAGNPFCKPLLVDCYLNLAEVNQDSKMKKDLLDTARKLSAGALDALKSPKAMTQSLICRVQSRIVSIRLAEDVKKACSDIAEVFQDASSMPPYSFGNLAYTSAVKMMECSVQFSQITEEWKLIGTTCKQLLSIVLANPVSLEALSNRKVQVLYRILISLAAETADRVSIIPLVMNSMSCTTMHLSEALATDERIKISLPADSEISLSYRLLESPIDLGAAIPIHLNDLAGVLKDNGSETMGLQLPISELVKLSKHLSKETQGFGQIIDWEESRHCSLLKLNALIKCNDESLNNVTYENVVADKDDKRKIIALGWIPYYQSNSMLRNSCDIIEHALAQLDPKFESGDDFSIMFICLNWPDSSIGNLFCTRKVSNSAIDAIKSMVANLLVTLARVSMSNLALLDEINWSWASLLDILSTELASRPLVTVKALLIIQRLMTQTDTYGWASENWSSPRSEANPCCQKLNLGDLSSSSACNGTVEDERKFYEWIERCVEARDTKYD